ncbi:hypothetical protein LEP1GSC170_2201 [Leptospira interrogans serovar Bataviae str. HAI135]|nr:hypothetical protein LEP1GSC170_2201 [Leptospira interrogans serovar Bataviae str. HAI135]
MKTKNSKQPFRHLKLLKPNRSGKDHIEQKHVDFPKNLKKTGLTIGLQCS